MSERFIGPLPEATYKEVTDELHLFRQDRAVELCARALYGQKILSDSLVDANERLASREIDSVSGVLSKDEWFERAGRTVIGLNMGRRALEKKSSAILFMFDAEKFKAINDNISWDEGNRRLRIIGTYLESMARLDQGDLIGRLGGDEFVWLATFNQEENNGLSILNSIEERLRDVVEEEHADLLHLRWNHVFHEDNEDIHNMLKRLDVKGQQKQNARSHSQSQLEYEQARKNAGVALSY